MMKKYKVAGNKKWKRNYCIGFRIVHKILANFVAFLLEHIVVEYKILFRKFEFYSHILSLDPTPIVSK